MSWSINIIGKPENINAALDEQSAQLTGASKEEFDAAIPHIKALVSLNYNKKYPNGGIKVTGSGHAYKDANNDYSQCNISIGDAGAMIV